MTSGTERLRQCPSIQASDEKTQNDLMLDLRHNHTLQLAAQL